MNVAAPRAPVGPELEPMGGLGLGIGSWFGSNLSLRLAIDSNLSLRLCFGFDSEGGLAWVKSRH